MIFTLENLIRHGARAIDAHRMICAKHSEPTVIANLTDSFYAFQKLAILLVPDFLEQLPGNIVVTKNTSVPEIFERFEYMLALLIDMASEPQLYFKIRSQFPTPVVHS